jgi:hypothetical protein
MTIRTLNSKAPGVSLSYITFGAILAVLAGTSYAFFQPGDGHPVLGYIRLCSLILGLVFLAIGFGVGRIGQVSGETERVHVQDVPANPLASPVATSPTAAANPIFTSTTSQGV